MRNFLACFAVLIFWGYFFLWPRFINHAAEWDALAYTAVVFSSENLSPQELHRQTFAAIKSDISPELFNEFTQLGSYRRAMADNPDAFNQQLPFYTTKILYIALLKLCYRFFGLKPLSAMAVLSALSVLLTIGAVALIFKQVVGVNLSVVLSLMIATLSGSYHAASLRLPDSLIMFLSVVVVVAILNKKSLLQIFICGVLAVLLRSDVALTVAGLILCKGFLIFYEKGSINKLVDSKLINYKNIKFVMSYVLAAVFILCGIPIVNWMGGGYNLKVLFHHTFVEYLIYPKTAEVASITLFDYLYLIKNAFGALLLDFRTSISAFSLVMLGFIWLTITQKPRLLFRGRLLDCLANKVLNEPVKIRQLYRPIVVGIVAYFTFVIRLLIFPLAAHRFILPLCVITWLCLFCFVVSCFCVFKAKMVD